MTVRKLKKKPLEKKSRKRYLYYVSPAIILVFALILMNFSSNVKAEDYTFSSENVIKGTSGSPANRNAEDVSFQTLTEANQYSDTYFSGSSESMTYGTTNGGSFPTALDTDDSTRRNYIEANLAAAATYAIIRPNADGTSITMTTYPASPTTHYTKVNEVTKDDETSYNAGVLTGGGEKDIYGMADPSDPGGSPNIDLTMWIYSRGVTASQCSLTYGLYIGTSSYVGATPLITTTTYTNYSYTWTLNPSTSAEWTFSQLASVSTYLLGVDGNPDTHTTQVAILITYNPTVDYEMQGTITYSSVLSTSQTTGFSVLCQGYRSGTENFYVQAWDYTGLSWTTKTTIQAGSDTDYNFNLISTERDSVNNEVKLRLIDVTGSDTVQDTLYLDLLKIKRTEVGYALEVEMTTGTTNQYGNQQLYIKGKTSAETFNVAVYNWTSSAYDTGKIAINSGTNTVYTYTLITQHHRSGSYLVKIQFTDGTSYTADQVQDVCSLDYVAVKHINSAPTLSGMGTDANKAVSGHNNLGEPMDFWATYTDIDDDAPTYMRVVINSVNYAMTKNNSGDTSYYNGCNYYFTKSDLLADDYNYYFACKDTINDEVTGGSGTFYVNTEPTLTLGGADPATGNYGTIFSFFVTYTDVDNDAPYRLRVFIDQDKSYHNMYKNFSDSYYIDGCAYWYYYGALTAGTHQFYFYANDNHGGITYFPEEGYFYVFVNTIPTLTTPTILPDETLYKDTEITFGITYTDADNHTPTIIIIVIEDTPYNLVEVNVEDTNKTDGKLYHNISISFIQGIYDYYFNATDGYGGWAETTTYQFTITNREPSITDYPVNPSNTWRNTYWEFDLNASDSDGDTLVWEIESNASFISINSSTGLLNGTTSNIPAWFDVTVYVNDSYSGSDNYYFKIYLINRVPVITSSGNLTQIETTFLSYQIIASDPDTDSLTYELYTNASWATISSNYVNGTATIIGWYTFSIWVNDSYSGSNVEYWTLNVTTLPSNYPPYFTSSPIIDGKNITWYIYIVIVVDPDNDPLTYSLSGNATFLSINTTTGLIRGTPTLIGNYYVNISVTDGEFYDYQNYSLNISAFSAFSQTDFNLVGIVGITFGMIISIGLFGITKRRKKNG